VLVFLAAACPTVRPSEGKGQERKEEEAINAQKEFIKDKWNIIMA
jgi:hypothetical protein